MIVISKENSVKFGEQNAPVGIYKPIEIKGDLFVLPDESEKVCISLSLNYTKRKVLNSEWIQD